MNRDAQPWPQRPPLDAFLHAAIGEELNGTTLTVLSALARRDLDPWRHAEYLRQLPAPLAVRELAKLIADLPPRFAEPPVASTTASRLLTLLTAADRAQPGIDGRADPTAPPKAPHARTLRILAAYVLFALLSEWLAAGWSAPASPPVAPVSAPAHAPAAQAAVPAQQ